MLEVIYVSSRSCTCELKNSSAYYSDFVYDVFIDGQLALHQVKTNVFSLFSLKPDTEYKVRANEEEITVCTLGETTTISPRDFGAKGDGITDDTDAIQTAIFACLKHGRVYFDEGTYLVRPLFLKDDITIEISSKAMLLGSIDRLRYPILPAKMGIDSEGFSELSSWEGEPQPTYASTITGIWCDNVHLIGEGTIDENAQNGDWWIDHKKMKDGAFRPKGIFLANCSNIHIQGLTIKNTPSWNLHPYFSKHLDFIDLKLISPKNSPNTDGCNPESCYNVNILGVNFSVGDDCIAIKSGKFAIGMEYRRPSEKITIRNCKMAYGHGGVVLGSEMSGGIRDLQVRQCLFEKTDRGLRIKTRRGRGESAVIDGITFENIVMQDVLTPLVINMYYYCDADGKTEYVWSKDPYPVDERTPKLGNFVFRNMVCRNVHVAAGFFYGLPERPIESISLENIEFTYAENPISDIPAMMSFLEPMTKRGLEFHLVDKVSLKNVKINGMDGEPFIFDQIKATEIN
ncbi:MAG: glycoside hydrolase family 28 protein [Bacilli bacterium]|nr:glycoside hydrolase family 28 protein [Bacilli bacterium]